MEENEITHTALIPMSNIRPEVRNIAVSWAEANGYNWIGDKHKLASDIQNYADWYANQSKWISVETPPDNEFWYRVLTNGKHNIFAHCFSNGKWWCYGESHPTDYNVTHWQPFEDLPTPPTP